MSVLDTAKAYIVAGFSPIPILTNGSKAPSTKWTRFQKEPMSMDEAEALFAGNVGVGICGGHTSGGLEVIDFDDRQAFELFREIAVADGVFPDVPVIRTPRGWHIYLKVHPENEIPGNRKLAMKKVGEHGDGRPKLKAIIETRGTGGQVVAPGSPPDCHPLKVEYVHEMGPSLTEWPMVEVVRPDHYQAILAIARGLTEVPEAATELHVERTTNFGGGERPGDEFSKNPNWHVILEPYGWVMTRSLSDGTQMWKRPGDSQSRWSATANRCKRPSSGHTLFYCFSSNAYPVEQERGYTAFELLATLKFGGDYAACAKHLQEEGFGGSAESTTHVVEKFYKDRGLDIPKETQKELDKAKEAEAMSPRDMERDDAIHELRAALEIPLIGLSQSTNDGSATMKPTYTLRVDNEEPIELGPVRVVRSATLFEERLSEVLRITLPVEVKKRGKWPRIFELLLSICVVEDRDMREEIETTEWVNDYMTAGHIVEEEKWKDALEGSHPFVKDGEAHIHAGNMRNWLGYDKDVKIGKKDLWARLRRLGFTTSRQTGRTKSNRVVTRTYWKVKFPFDALTGHDEVGE